MAAAGGQAIFKQLTNLKILKLFEH